MVCCHDLGKRLWSYFVEYNITIVLVIRNKFLDPLARTPAWSSHSPGSFCDKCGVTFATQHALLRHVTSKHEEVRTSTAYCSICHRFFKTKWSLSTHNSKYHRTSNFVIGWFSFRLASSFYIRIGSRQDRYFGNFMKLSSIKEILGLYN